jgi:uncharacterized protein (UPF0333 family)
MEYSIVVTIVLVHVCMITYVLKKFTPIDNDKLLDHVV